MWFISYIHERTIGMDTGRHQEYEYNNILVHEHPLVWLTKQVNDYDDLIRILFYSEVTDNTVINKCKDRMMKTHTRRHKPYSKD